MTFTRVALLEKFRHQLSQGKPIVGGGAGTGISAKCEEAGGIDLIIIYNSGRYRMAGRGSLSGMLPFGNANQIVKEMAYEVLTAVKHTPVLAGVCATDPFMLRDHFLKELKDMGFAGIQNFPTVGLIDGLMRENLEEMNQRGVAEKWPVILGGAALTRSFVEQDLAEIFEGEVRYARDAFEGLKLMDALVKIKRGDTSVTLPPLKKKSF